MGSGSYTSTWDTDYSQADYQLKEARKPNDKWVDPLTVGDADLWDELFGGSEG